jgi:hypothetical protein
MVIPVFLFRHFVTDKGQFPDHMWSDLIPQGKTELGPTRAGLLPYVTPVVGGGFVFLGWFIFWT